VLLALAAGVVDAVGYLEAGVFTANMTGNTVLVGIALGQGDWGAAAQRLGALALFFAGAVAGDVLRRAGGGRATLPLAVETALLVAVAFLSPSIAVTAHAVAFAMGLQATAMLTFGGVALSTVVVTSTMARVAERAGQRIWREPRRDGVAPPPPPARAGRLWFATWIVYGSCAAAGVFLVPFGARAMLAAAPLIALAAILVLPMRDRRAPSGTIADGGR
jgi:uncharacterized membrane protein YoaK (UPF0700 family)